MPFFWRFICPLSVAGELSGRYCWTAFAVSPGQVVNWLFCMAFMRVLFGGLNKHWCRYFISDSFDDIVYALLATWLGVSVSSAGGVGEVSRVGLSGRTQSPVVGSRCPFQTKLLVWVTRHVFSSYVTMQPASHNTLMEIRDACAKPGTMCASWALCGSPGTFRRHV
jgi:hypothetical protein